MKVLFILLVYLIINIQSVQEQNILTAGDKQYNCDKRYAFRWNKDISISMDCKWKYSDKPVCGYNYINGKWFNFVNECVACLMHFRIQNFTFGKCK